VKEHKSGIDQIKRASFSDEGREKKKKRSSATIDFEDLLFIKSRQKGSQHLKKEGKGRKSRRRAEAGYSTLVRGFRREGKEDKGEETKGG